MAPSIRHPFTVDVRACPGASDQFRWSIKMHRGPTRYSSTDYETFEEARVAVKQTLGRLITDWQTG